MNNRARKTIQKIFADPVSHNIAWDEIEALLIALGAEITEGAGSRVKFDLNGITAAFHRPHNPKIARAYQLEKVRDFLRKAGITQ